jgi:BirA family biotin operon repressor/biotin-[acetyl-CoA-carboxylase] ligase
VDDKLCGHRLRGPLTYFDTTTSTNDTLRELALAGAPEGVVVVAGEQTRGRGRRGRAWHGEKSRSLLFSLLLRPKITLDQWPALAWLAGLATAEACAAIAGCPIGTKWPNDVIFEGRKLAGVLVESRIPDFAVVGIGVNVAGLPTDFPAELALTATSLEAVGGAAVSAEDTLAGIVNCLDALYQLVLQGRTSELLDRSRAFESTLGKHLTIQLGERQVEGFAADLTAQGGLILRTADGELTLTAGEVQRVRTLNGANLP